MSTKEIIAELPKLTPDERLKILAKIRELQGDEWQDEGELTEEQKRLIEKRVAEHERNPQSAIPWKKFEARLNKRIGK